MNIVVSGCSNSSIDPYYAYKKVKGEWPHGEDPRIWPTILSENLDATSITNLSFGGKGNNRIIADVIDHILANDVDIVILQLTVLDRLSLWNSNVFPSKSYDWHANKNNSRPWVPFVVSNHDVNTTWTADTDRAFRSYRADGKEIINQVANDVLLVQMLCEQRGIDLVIINWFPEQPLKSYSAWNLISKDYWLFDTGCMYNYIRYKGFKPFDGGHFGNDAHEHIANMIEDYILRGIQYTNNHTTTKPVYDYT